jgi:hypothetical protein
MRQSSCYTSRRGEVRHAVAAVAGLLIACGARSSISSFTSDQYEVDEIDGPDSDT